MNLSHDEYGDGTMSTLAARNQFRNGLMALVDGRHEEAAKCFGSAMALEREDHDAGRCTARSLSYYGLSLALANRPTPEAIQACEMAARADRLDPDLLLNLGRVMALAGRRTKALAAFEEGLKMNPQHRALKTELAKLDRRSRPVVPFLHRDHPVNFLFGKLRARLTSSSAQKRSGAGATGGAGTHRRAQRTRRSLEPT
jgi:tetratricopeptide (TPR) repeat protein